MKPLLIAAAVLTVLVRGEEQPEDAAIQTIQSRQSCQGPVAEKPQMWWRAQIGHNGTTPYATDSTYEYYRTATQYGADNSGKKDSSEAFNKAINGG